MILKQKDSYERMKYNLISENGDEKRQNVKLNSIKLKKKNSIKFFFGLFFVYIRDGYKHVRNKK